MLIGVDFRGQRVGVHVQVALISGLGVFQHRVSCRHMQVAMNIDGEVLLAVGHGAVVTRIARRGVIMGRI